MPPTLIVRLSHCTGGRCRNDRIKLTSKNLSADHKGFRVNRQSKTAIENGRNFSRDQTKVCAVQSNTLLKEFQSFVDSERSLWNTRTTPKGVGHSILVEGSKLVVLGTIESLLVRPHCVFFPKAAEEVTDAVA